MSGLVSPVSIYWDSCAWLALINQEAGRLPDVDAVYELARKGHIELWSSTLSLVECNRPASEKQLAKPIPPESLAALDGLFFQPFVKLVPLDIDIGLRARKLVRETVGLKKGADAIHLASAMRWNLHILHTYNGSDLKHLSGSVTCDDGTSMTISDPFDPFAKGGLFDQQQPA